MVKVRVPGAAQRLTSYYNIEQSTDRIARVIANGAVCRTFMRSILLLVVDRQ
jgi:hypothetical protein